MAQGVKARGMPVIALLSRQHQARPSSSSGKKLIDFADVVLDNGCPGGPVVEFRLEWRTGPTSTVTGTMIMNMVRCTIAERLLARGVKPEMLPRPSFCRQPRRGRTVGTLLRSVPAEFGPSLSVKVLWN